ncbi:DUF342 domain-containing protein [Microbispora bryophytorum]|uniref:DUF342 domain-containing protein n=2 Tax=Microbispora bryophytorum TaxID=1460882 RepID=A0A8H9GTS2_9ACTN|nr:MULTISPECIES: DUF342 domain-containing protein [Microbispora]MBD3135783.1 hypothetical protein [Microbispora bryophytorum]MBD3143363.1 hypothetical protein [Microbispora camponoti]TQS09936.1 DUF342 domain-containing protein [Microbispora bryophytorum]GGN99466.1 hypothetical protein GCM10011574_05130 [Microbispora bryophytorum]
MDDPELKKELDEVDTQIERLREETRQIREEIGQSWDAPTDMAERATLLTNVEQQEALIDDLQVRREQILRRMKG